MPGLNEKLETVRRLVGPATEEALRHVDVFAGDDAVLFMPVGGACAFALRPHHAHPSYMFCLHFNDGTSLEINGAVVDGEPGRVLAVSPGVAHQERPSDFPPSYVAAFIAKDLFEGEFRHYSGQEAPVLEGSVVSVPSSYLNCLKRFMVESESGLAGKGPMLRSYAVEICHVLIRSLLEIPGKSDAPTERVEIGRCMEHMYSRLADKLTVKELADASRMSESHFSRIFKRETGMTPMDYLNALRLRQAKKLLAAGGKRIAEIAFECGFSSPSYLSERFKRAYKITPSSFLSTKKA